ncbi:MAG: EF-hand domain-containing protein [Brevundimonas sp.]|uniref:EF-hand domain-containing protein n=1 Tax=Brevundimonas sp. TaxID=1871086 RepID=UPI00391C5182
MTYQANLGTAAALGVLLLAAPAAAQTGPGVPGGGMGPPRALAHVPAWADRLFDRLDANQDGAVTGDELAVLSRGPAGAMGGSRLRRMIGQSDASNDGRISREEMTAGAQRMFNRMDANGDGLLSETERPRPAAPPASPAMPMPAAEPETMPFPDMAGGV